jgi:hypothetical protein
LVAWLAVCSFFHWVLRKVLLSRQLVRQWLLRMRWCLIAWLELLEKSQDTPGDSKASGGPVYGLSKTILDGLKQNRLQMVWAASRPSAMFPSWGSGLICCIDQRTVPNSRY